MFTVADAYEFGRDTDPALDPNHIGGGGQLSHATQNLVKKFLCYHHNNPAYKKQISLLDNALIMT